MGLSSEEFCARFGLGVDELRAIREDKPVEAGVPLRLAAALGWTPTDIEMFLEKAVAMPLKCDGKIVSGSNPVPRVARRHGRPGPFLRAYVDPANCVIESIDVVRPLGHCDQAFADQNLLGRDWVGLYADDYVETLESAVRAAVRREDPPVIWGQASDGSPGSVSCRSDGALVKLQYDILPAHIHPIGRRWSFASIWKGKAQITT